MQRAALEKQVFGSSTLVSYTVAPSLPSDSDIFEFSQNLVYSIRLYLLSMLINFEKKTQDLVFNCATKIFCER